MRDSPSAVMVAVSHAGLQPAADQTLILAEDPRAWFTQAGDKLVGVPARSIATLRRFGPTPR